MPRIPNILHQSWKNQDVPHHIYRKCWIDSWRTHHPDWRHLFWTDADNHDLVRIHYPAFYPAYLALDPPIKQADFARFLYMHRFGGLYVDLDFLCLKPFTPLLDDAEILLGRLSDDNPYYQIPNALLASSAGNDFWLRVAHDALGAPTTEHEVEQHTGPLRLQWSLLRYQPAHVVIHPSAHLYPIDWIHLLHWNNDRYYRSDRAELHQQARSASPEEVAALFPEAYAITFWTHNW